MDVARDKARSFGGLDGEAGAIAPQGRRRVEEANDLTMVRSRSFGGLDGEAGAIAPQGRRRV